MAMIGDLGQCPKLPKLPTHFKTPSQAIVLLLDFATSNCTDCPVALRPTPMMMRPPGVGGPPRLPGSPIGGPGGPGPTPMVSPGAGGGVKAAATEQIKSCMRNIQVAGLNFDPGSKEFNAVMGALRTLNGIFGKPSDADLDPAARARMAQPPPSPLAGMAPAGMAGAPPGAGAPPPGGPPPGMGPSEVGGGGAPPF